MPVLTIEDVAESVRERLDFDDQDFPSGLNISGRDWGGLETALSQVPNAEKEIGASVSLTMVRDRLLEKVSDDQTPGDFISERIEAACECEYDQFSFLAVSMNGTVALLARPADNPDRVSVLRIVPHPDSPSFNKARRADSMRSEFPGLLQPSAVPVSLGQNGENYFQIEILMPGQIIELSDDEYKAYAEFLSDLTKDTVYEPRPGHEIMAMSDGTAVLFDPGECPYKPEFWDMSLDRQRLEIDGSNDLIAQRLKALQVTEMFQFFDRDGVLKQDRVHPPEDGIRNPEFQNNDYLNVPTVV